MPAGYAEARNIVFPTQADPVRWYLHEKSNLLGGKKMSRTLKAIERHMRLPSKEIVGRLGHTPLRKRRLTETAYNKPAKLVAEWQQHGPETLSGYAVRKLRLVFGPAPVGAC